MYVVGGQPLFNNGFTLIELLAVLVLLAIIALIAISQVLNIINNSRKKSTEISVQNYLKAVDVAIMNKEVNGEKVLDGVYNVTANGKLLDYPDDNIKNDINVEFEGQGLTEGIIKIENNKVVNLDTKIDKWYVTLNNGITNLKDKQEKSVLVSGISFNVKLKKLVDTTNNNISYLTTDEKVVSIEFYSNGILPSGYTKETLEGLGEENRVDVSTDGTIIAYNNNGNIYIVSDNLIIFNENCNYMFRKLTKLNSIQFNNVNIEKITTVIEMFAFCNNLKNLDVSKFDTSNVMDMAGMFAWCSSLKELDVSNFNTSNVTGMKEMFWECSSLTALNINNFDTQNVKTMYQMFRGCTKLESLDLSNFNTEKVTTMHGMFAECNNLTKLNISSFNTSQVTDMGGMFAACSNLSNLDLSSFDTLSVTNMGEMFLNCSSLTMLDLTNFNTNNVVSMTYMFKGCKKLKPIFVGENWQIPENTINMFANCATENENQLCKPDSAHEWCVVPVS